MERKLEYIYTVYKEKSFRTAAEKLYISQPSLSITVKRTEESLGIEIFDRSQRPLELTDSGRAFIEYIEETIMLEEKLLESLSDIENLNLGQLQVGCTNYIMTAVLPGILHRIFASHPGIKINICEDSSFNLRQRILSGELDIVIDCFDTSDPGFQSYPLFTEPMLLVLPNAMAADPLLTPYRLPEGITAEQLDDYPFLPEELTRELLLKPFLSFRPGNDVYNRIEEIFAQRRLKPDVKLEFDQISTCITFIEEDVGFSILPITPFLNPNRSFHASLFRIANCDSPRTQRLILKRGKYRSRAMELFIRVAREMYQA